MKNEELYTKTLEAILRCNTPQRDLFKRMYPCTNADASLQEHVYNIPTNKLQWAYTQIINTITINDKKIDNLIDTPLQAPPLPIQTKQPTSTRKSYRINERDNSIIRLYTHEVLDENNHVVYEGISYDKCMAYIELEELQR
jgi:hypothetical protein